MTLRQPNIERMLGLGLTGMAEALAEQRDVADIEQLGFDDRLAMLIEREAEHRGPQELSRPSAPGATAHARRHPRRRLPCRARHRPHNADPARRRRLDPPGPELDRRRTDRVGKDLPRLRARPPSLPPEALRALPPRPPSWSASSPAPAIPDATTA